ncbi:MAG: hypothetical protein AAGE96_08845 [Cyanobacteria bacterium P01_G01_bin.19]
MNLKTEIVRTIWSLVETSNPYSLLKLSDRELSQQLIQKIEKAFSLSSEDSQTLADYISSKILLIRDLVDSKIN